MPDTKHLLKTIDATNTIRCSRNYILAEFSCIYSCVRPVNQKNLCACARPNRFMHNLCRLVVKKSPCLSPLEFREISQKTEAENVCFVSFCFCLYEELDGFCIFCSSDPLTFCFGQNFAISSILCQ